MSYACVWCSSAVFCQIFNEMNARQMIKVNIFDGILENHIFVAVIVITAFLQVCRPCANLAIVLHG